MGDDKTSLLRTMRTEEQDLWYRTCNMARLASWLDAAHRQTDDLTMYRDSIARLFPCARDLLDEYAWLAGRRDPGWPIASIIEKAGAVITAAVIAFPEWLRQSWNEYWVALSERRSLSPPAKYARQVVAVAGAYAMVPDPFASLCRNDKEWLGFEAGVGVLLGSGGSVRVLSEQYGKVIFGGCQDAQMLAAFLEHHGHRPFSGWIDHVALVLRRATESRRIHRLPGAIARVALNWCDEAIWLARGIGRGTWSGGVCLLLTHVLQSCDANNPWYFHPAHADALGLHARKLGEYWGFEVNGCKVSGFPGNAREVPYFLSLRG